MFDLPTTITFAVLTFVLLYPSYYYAKKKNLHIGWNLFLTCIFGPLWWIVLMLRKKKEYQVFKYKRQRAIFA